jgi:hypothetical protein
LRPVVDHGHHLPSILGTEVHPTGASEQTAVVFADEADSWSVYDGREILDVVDQHLAGTENSKCIRTIRGGRPALQKGEEHWVWGGGSHPVVQRLVPVVQPVEDPPLGQRDDGVRLAPRVVLQRLEGVHCSRASARQHQRQPFQSRAGTK